MSQSHPPAEPTIPQKIISVDTFVSVLCRGIDLNESTYSLDRAEKEAVRSFTVEQTDKTINYPVGYHYKRDDLTFLFEGTITALTHDDQLPLIETVAIHDPRNIDAAHLICKTLAYLYGKTEEYHQVEGVINWYSLDGVFSHSESAIYSLSELETFFEDQVQLYLEVSKNSIYWMSVRNESIAESDFPFAPFRKGQREMMAEIYTAAKNKGQVLVQAPTGIGKTLASLFPAIKSLEAGFTEKIFYLTARTTGREIAENALTILRDRGLRIKSVTIVSKEKICFIKDNPKSCDTCKYAKGYYERLNPALIEGRQKDALTREVVEEVSEKFGICPFEFSLDISMLCDVVICDFNYLFDPFVSLKRYFGSNGGEYHFLVDEAHNLVDRGRDMYSAELDKADILAIRRELKPYKDSVKYIYRDLGKVNTWFLNKRKEKRSTTTEFIEREFPEELLWRLRAVVRATDDWLDLNKGGPYKKVLLDTYYTIKKFVTIAELYNERFRCIYTPDAKNLVLKLYCIDPSEQLHKALMYGTSTAVFSATLSPMHYYKQLLGVDSDAQVGALPSPFPTENLKVLIADTIETTYKQRNASLGSVVDSIDALVNAKPGNYMVYFPSYAYMNHGVEQFISQNPHVKTVVQESGMAEDERTAFIEHFHEFAEERNAQNPQSLVGFAVMGGVFSEGVDLIGDRLSGVAIVGVGLPGISTERNLVKDYFDTHRVGFEYAYMYPGMNKVLQAAGRVIRTMSDRGTVLLIDSRFSRCEYSELFPPEWKPIFIKTPSEVSETLSC
ncbi:MAG: ATP-dependent DNA helicase [Fibrobacterales bacterium]